MTYRTVYKAIALIVFFMILAPLSSQVFFSGRTGISTIVSLQDKTFYPQAQLQGFFNGQVEFSPQSLLRMQFSAATNNIFGVRNFENIPSNFSIDTLSYSYHFVVKSDFHNYFGVFVNEEDPVGSDTFLRRYFGATAFASEFTRTIQNSNSASIYTMNGIGLSYTIRFPSPVAIAAYGYVSNPAAGIGLNFDVRLAGRWKHFMMDAALGISGDGTNKDDAGNPVIFLMKTITLRAAVTMLFGNELGSNLLLQFGIYRGVVNPNINAPIGLSDIYALFEPRFRIGRSRLSFSFFSFPKPVYEKLFYTDDPSGVNIAWISDSIFAQNISAGINLAATTKDLLNPLILEHLNITVTPVLTLKTSGGNVDFAIKVNVLRFNEISKALSFKIGYKTAL